MTTYLPDTAEATTRFNALLSSLPEDMASCLRLSLDGNELVMEGHVGCYEEKRKIEVAARSAGFTIHNHLRVIPGAFAPLQPSVPAAISEVVAPL